MKSLSDILMNVSDKEEKEKQEKTAKKEKKKGGLFSFLNKVKNLSIYFKIQFICK